jgi:transposase
MRKHYTAQQKTQIVLEMLKEEKTISQIASENGVHANQLYRWKAQVLEGLPALFGKGEKAERGKEMEQKQQVEALYAEIGRLTTQLAWLKKKSGIEPDAR